MRILAVVLAACVLFAACSSSSPEPPTAMPGADAGTPPSSSSSSGSGVPAPDAATTTTDDASSPLDTGVPAEDVAPGAEDAPSTALDAAGTGGEDAQSLDVSAPSPDAAVTGDAGIYGPNWKLVCPNTMSPMTCCGVYCGCMQQRCATEIKGGFPGGKDCMSYCLQVGPTLKRGPLSTGIQFLVCEC